LRRWRRQLAVGPDGTVGKIFFFPDGNGAFERVDGKAASVERGSTVWRADCDEYAGLANFEATEAMRYRDAIDGEFHVDFGADLAEFRQCHRFVGFIFKVERAAPVGIVANTAVKGDDSAVGIGANVADEHCGIDRIVTELDEIVGGSGGHWRGSGAFSRR